MRQRETLATKADFRIETMRGKGPGGQKRNKTDSCVRITHIPTGLSEYCCDTKSQHQNRATAFRRLAKRVVKELLPDTAVPRYAAGTEVVRSYNEPDNRVVDKVAGRFSYTHTVGRGDISDIINARALAMTEA